MIVRVKLFATLRNYLPPDSNGEFVELDVPEGTAPREIIDRLDLPAELVKLVMIDGFHLLPDDVQNRGLQPGEVLAIFPPIAGG